MKPDESAAREDVAKWPEKAIRAYRRKWREITGVNPPHEGNTTHEYALAAALSAPLSERPRLDPRKIFNSSSHYSGVAAIALLTLALEQSAERNST